MAFYYYGKRALLVTAISVSVSVLTDYICSSLTKRRFDYKDMSAVMSGMLLALLMPASVPYGIVAFTAVFMISCCKYAFGGNNNLIFSPAAVAYVFAALSWPNNVLRYPAPVPFGNLSLASNVPDVLDRSFTYYIDQSPSVVGYLDILCGKLTGPMGTYSVLIIAICAVSLYFFRDIPSPVFFSAIASNVLLFVLFPISVTGWQAALYSLITGSYAFVLVFMACDYRFVPNGALAQTMYGILFAVLSFVLRKHAGFENSAVFALLIICIFSTELDRLDIVITNGLQGFVNWSYNKISKLWIYIRFKSGTEDTARQPKKLKKNGNDKGENDLQG